MSRIERKNRDSVRHNRGQMSGLIGHCRGVFMDSVWGWDRGEEDGVQNDSWLLALDTCIKSGICNKGIKLCKKNDTFSLAMFEFGRFIALLQRDAHPKSQLTFTEHLHCARYCTKHLNASTLSSKNSFKDDYYYPQFKYKKTETQRVNLLAQVHRAGKYLSRESNSSPSDPVPASYYLC